MAGPVPGETVPVTVGATAVDTRPRRVRAQPRASQPPSGGGAGTGSLVVSRRSSPLPLPGLPVSLPTNLPPLPPPSPPKLPLPLPTKPPLGLSLPHPHPSPSDEEA